MTCDETFRNRESQLNAVHKALAEYSGAVAMRYRDKVEAAPVSAGWKPVCPGVRQAGCQLPTRASTVLNVVFEAGALLPSHSHDDREETVFVIEGGMVDRHSGTVIKEGDLVVIPPERPHEFFSENGCLCNVVFRPKW